MNLNLHGIVRGAIASINEDVSGTVYVSTGRTNVQGILTPTYTSVAAKLQVQAHAHSAIEMARDRGLRYQHQLYKVYAFGNFTDVARPDAKGADLCNFGGQWWAITQVFEWWSNASGPAWCSFEVTRQVNAATLAALQAQLANGANA